MALMPVVNRSRQIMKKYEQTVPRVAAIEWLQMFCYKTDKYMQIQAFFFIGLQFSDSGLLELPYTV
ncbi:hypothetical protein [Shewanella sp.]|uniref:hypothetical protein n=1 Tax=Shewanella sp. TaxID=50422 RepID=UPI003563A4CA